ncbi:MAG: AMP-binding protein, partial [Actinomycetia bacterium]|nr:AMP-binding protein [Actinomycetes bacterium]
MSDEALENLLIENRTFPPSEAFAAQANVKEDAYGQARSNRLDFWAEQARRLDWARDWDEVLDWSDAPFAKWFTGGALNVAYNCVDRHVASGHGGRVAIIFEAESGEITEITYDELLERVSRAANAMLDLGIKAGERVAIYLPMIPEA